MDDVRIRLPREGDLPSAERASVATFLESENRTRRVGEPEARPRSRAASEAWMDRMRFHLDVDPGATRRYRLAGFSLHPLLRMVGEVDLALLPWVTGLAEGTADDLAWMDRLDAEVRGAGHGPDHRLLLRRMRLVVARGSRPGYVYVDERGRASLLAAADPRSPPTCWSRR